MNTEPRLPSDEIDQDCSGVHWLLWTYNCTNGLSLYDPYGHDEYSKDVKIAAEAKGFTVKLSLVNQQVSHDSWSCGYRALTLALASALHSKTSRPGVLYPRQWQQNIITPTLTNGLVSFICSMRELFENELERRKTSNRPHASKLLSQTSPLIQNFDNADEFVGAACVVKMNLWLGVLKSDVFLQWEKEDAADAAGDTDTVILCFNHITCKATGRVLTSYCCYSLCPQCIVDEFIPVCRCKDSMDTSEVEDCVEDSRV